MKDVESAGRALEAYARTKLTAMNDGEITEAVQDLLTDLEHFQEAYGIRANDYAAHLHYLQEAGRCLECGSTREELQTEYEAEKATNDDHYRLMPPDECAGWWDKLGEAGPHKWEELPARAEKPPAVKKTSPAVIYRPLKVKVEWP
jgi:hypothetical protein